MKFSCAVLKCFGSASKSSEDSESRHGKQTSKLTFVNSCLVFEAKIRLKRLRMRFLMSGYLNLDETGEGNGDRFRIFSYQELRSATQGFRSSCKIGEGGFGTVYKVII